MTLRRRLSVFALIVAAAMVALALGRSYSADIVETVVGRSLAQKTRSSGISAEAVRSAFHAALARRPGKQERLEFLLELARSLEKVQRLDPGDFEKIVGESVSNR